MTTAAEHDLIAAWEAYRRGAPEPTPDEFLAEQLHARFQAPAWTVTPGTLADTGCQMDAPDGPRCFCGDPSVHESGLCATCARLLARPETCPRCHTAYVNHQHPCKPLGVCSHRTCACESTLARPLTPTRWWRVIEVHEAQGVGWGVLLGHGPRPHRRYELVNGRLYPEADQAAAAGRALPYPHEEDRWSVAPLVTGQYQAVTVAGLGGGRDLGPPRGTRAEAIEDGGASGLACWDVRP